MANGRELAYFRGIDSDTTFTGLTLDKDSIKYAPPIHLNHIQLEKVVAKTLDKLSLKAKQLEGARHEMDYYISIHNVQDEGYDMVANHDKTMTAELERTRQLIDMLSSVCNSSHIGLVRTTIKTNVDLLQSSDVAVTAMGGHWRYGRWWNDNVVPHLFQGKEIDYQPYIGGGRLVCVSKVGGNGSNEAATLVCRTDSLGVYTGQVDSIGQADGHGSYLSADGTYYEGHWSADLRNGFGFAVNETKLNAGEWKDDKFRGERMQYTSERIYGIDISKYQHGKGRRHYTISWNRLRISHLGKVGSKNAQGTVDYPVSFVYIKSTEGASVRNPYYSADYRQARHYGFHTGAYHFFSINSSATAQANYFIRNSYFKRGDMPPVLDLEPTDDQIKKIGGATALFRAVRTWLSIVQRRTGVRPVLYVSQRFVNKYLAPDIKRDYNIWIARYGEYKPDVKLVYWQLCPDGRVVGIHGEVDINVFNGYRGKFNEFIDAETVK